MKKNTAWYLTALIAALAWIALILQLVLMIRKSPVTFMGVANTALNYFSYFTILSNLMVAVSCTYSLKKRDAGFRYFFTRVETRTGIQLYILVVGIVYSVALRKIWNPQGLDKVADEMLHDIIPVLHTLWWILFAPRKALVWKNAAWWLIIPALYLGYSMLRGVLTGRYPYYFINTAELGIGKVMVNSAVMLAAFVGLGLLLIAVNKSLPKKTA